jgi:hypothetical protein
MADQEQIELEKQMAIAAEKVSYEAAKAALQAKKDENKKAIDDIKKDPFKKQKDLFKKRKENRVKRKKKTKEEKRKARKQKVKAILSNGKKTLIPILTLLLTNKIADVVAQNDKIKKLVDDTNAIITDANESGDPTKLANAQVARDAAVKIINDNEDKILKIKKDIDRISIYITIFNIIVNIIGPVLLSTPTPSPAPDVITPPKENFRRKIYEPTLKLLNGLSALLPVVSSILEKAIAILEDLKSQLLNINGQLESTDANTPYTGGYGSAGEKYKGFRFAIREDNSFGGKVSVSGFKRHYAVAIDINDVEVLKSELSFTLDPNDLIDQLKLVIDNQGLFTGPVPNANTIEQ